MKYNKDVALLAEAYGNVKLVDDKPQTIPINKPMLPKKEHFQVLLNTAKDLVNAKDRGNSEAIGYLIDELRVTIQKLENI